MKLQLNAVNANVSEIYLLSCKKRSGDSFLPVGANLSANFYVFFNLNMKTVHLGFFLFYFFFI